ncbi:helix-turn-helix domain-containing protein [Lentilactobacillus rapi]|nr:AraC family transcriptional regulator [Lentilactobacillus rapi]
MAGFNNVTYFIKVFKRVVGQTPLDYRNSVGRR